MFATAVIPFIIVAVVNYQLYRINFFGAVLYGYSIVLLNDILVRVYAGGTHDQEGKAWVMLLSTSAFVLCTVSLLIYAFTTLSQKGRNSTIKNRIQNFLAVILCGACTVAVYLNFLVDL